MQSSHRWTSRGPGYAVSPARGNDYYKTTPNYCPKAAAGSDDSSVLLAPKGCPSGAVCFYRQGNGGDLCGVWYVSTPGLGSCANIGPSGSIFNNGGTCGGCQDVNLYWGSGYTGAWYCLPKGHYLLYIEQDHFYLGQGLPGYGPDGSLSARPTRWSWWRRIGNVDRLLARISPTAG